MHSRGRRSGSDHDWSTGQSSRLGILSEGRSAMRVYDVPFRSFARRSGVAIGFILFYFVTGELGHTKAHLCHFSGFGVDG